MSTENNPQLPQPNQQYVLESSYLAKLLASMASGDTPDWRKRLEKATDAGDASNQPDEEIYQG